MTHGSPPTTPLKVLFLTSWYPIEGKPFHGIFVQRQAESLAPYCEVSTVYVCSAAQKNVEVKTIRGIYTVIVYFKRIENFIFPFSYFLRLYRYLFAWKKALKIFLRQKGKPDIIHANIVYPVSVIAAFLKRIWGIPYIISEHFTGYFPADGQYKGFLLKKLSAFGVRGSSAVITVSKSLVENMRRAGLASNYRIIPNVVDTTVFNVAEDYAPMPDEFTFLHVSLLNEKQKNISGIINSFSRVNKTFPTAKLVMAGEGEDKVLLQKHSEKLGIGNAVSFIGYKSNEEIARLMQKSGAVVLFSNFESQSIVLLEALCCGIPVISSKCGGPEEYVTSQNGLLVEIGNEKQLADAMIQMVKNRAQYNSVEIRKSVVDMVSKDNVAQKIMEVYHTVLKK